MIRMLCVSPAHVLTAFILKEVYFQNKNLGIVLLDYHPNARKMYDQLKKFQDFAEVRFIKAKKIWKKSALQNDKIFNLWFFTREESYLKKLGIDISDTEQFLFPYRDPIAALMTKCITARGKRCIFSYYDDGTAPYYDANNVISTKPARLELLLRVPLRYYVPQSAYMFSPEMSGLENEIKTYKIRTPKNKEFFDKINQYYGYQSYEERKYIVFDQCGNYEGSREDMDEVNKLLEIVGNVVDKKQAYVKKHPRRSLKIYEESGWDIFPLLQEIPYEVSLLNSDKIEEQVMMADFSASLTMPKQLFDYEPTVIFLYRLINIAFTTEKQVQLDCVVNNLRDMYREKDKVFVPETLEQLSEFINKL